MQFVKARRLPEPRPSRRAPSAWRGASLGRTAAQCSSINAVQHNNEPGKPRAQRSSPA